jgi:hypothetical protein
MFGSVHGGMGDEEQAYGPARHPLADDAYWEQVGDAEKRDDVGVPQVLPSDNLVPERLQGMLRMVERWNGRRAHLPNGFVVIGMLSDNFDRNFDHTRAPSIYV